MTNLVKCAVGAAMSTFGNAYADTVFTANIGIRATVQPHCSFTGSFDSDDLSTQTIDIDSTLPPRPLSIFNSNSVACNAIPSMTTLRMVSVNGGLKHGATILPYTVTGSGDKNMAAENALVANFHSITKSSANLLGGGAKKNPEAIPTLLAHLNQRIAKAARPGNYSDTLTLVITITP